MVTDQGKISKWLKAKNWLVSKCINKWISGKIRKRMFSTKMGTQVTRQFTEKQIEKDALKLHLSEKYKLKTARCHP